MARSPDIIQVRFPRKAMTRMIRSTVAQPVAQFSLVNLRPLTSLKQRGESVHDSPSASDGFEVCG